MKTTSNCHIQCRISQNFQIEKKDLRSYCQEEEEKEEEEEEIEALMLSDFFHINSVQYYKYHSCLCVNVLSQFASGSVYDQQIKWLLFSPASSNNTIVLSW